MAKGDVVLVGLDFQIDDFNESIPTSWKWDERDKWRYLTLLCHIKKFGGVRDDDEEIAVKAGVKPVGSYRKAVEKLRLKLTFHPEKPGLLIQTRVYEERRDYLNNKEKTRSRVQRHREKKRVTNLGVTRSSTTTLTSTTIKESPPVSPPKRRSRLSLESLPNDWRAYAIERRPELCPDTVWEDFRDYWLGNGGVKVDWKRTWQRWVRNEKTRRVNGQDHQPTRDERAKRAILEGLGLDGGPGGSETAGGFAPTLLLDAPLVRQATRGPEIDGGDVPDGSG